MNRYLPLLVVLALDAASSASAREPTYNAATTNAVAACRTQYAAGGMTAAQLWQCSDKATLAFERKDDPLNMDLYQAAATRDEQVAALFDAGKLDKAGADALYDSTAAEVQKTLQGRREAMEENRPSSCSRYSDVSSGGNANCY